MKGAFIGPSFSNEDIKKNLDTLMVKYIKLEKTKINKICSKKKFLKEK